MKRLAISAVGTGAGTLLYTTPTDFKAEVRDIVFSNTTTAAISFKLHIVPSGDSVADANMFVPNVSVPGNTMVHWSGHQTLNPGDFIQGIGSAAGMTVTISGDETRRGGAV